MFLPSFLPTNLTHNLLLFFVVIFKDGFYPARRACILSIEKCLDYFPIRTQLVANMLPVVGRASVDPYKQVRDPAMRCLKKIVKKIENEAAEMPDEPPAQLSSDGKASLHVTRFFSC